MRASILASLRSFPSDTSTVALSDQFCLPTSPPESFPAVSSSTPVVETSIHEVPQSDAPDLCSFTRLEVSGRFSMLLPSRRVTSFHEPYRAAMLSTIIDWFQLLNNQQVIMYASAFKNFFAGAGFS